MGLGQLRGPSWETGTPLDCPNQMAIVALDWLEVCDGAHRSFVMKKVEGPRPLLNPTHRKVRDEWGTRLIGSAIMLRWESRPSRIG